MGDKSDAFEPPDSGNQMVTLHMPFQRSFATNTELNFRCGNVIVEAELEVLFYLISEQVIGTDHQDYVTNSSIALKNNAPIGREPYEKYIITLTLNKSFISMLCVLCRRAVGGRSGYGWKQYFFRRLSAWNAYR